MNYKSLREAKIPRRQYEKKRVVPDYAGALGDDEKNT